MSFNVIWAFLSASGTSIKRFLRVHPTGLWVLCSVEVWERFSYYGMRAILVLYLTSPSGKNNPGLGWCDADAYQLYGAYITAAPLTPLVGGVIADRLLGTHRAVVVGGCLIATGHAMLAFSAVVSTATGNHGMFIAGLVVIVLGTGLFKPSVGTMVGELYDREDLSVATRNAGFSLFYMSINVGAFLGAVVAGPIGENISWHVGFATAMGGMIVGLLGYFLARSVSSWLHGIGLSPTTSISLTSMRSSPLELREALVQESFSDEYAADSQPPAKSPMTSKCDEDVHLRGDERSRSTSHSVTAGSSGAPGNPTAWGKFISFCVVVGGIAKSFVSMTRAEARQFALLLILSVFSIAFFAPFELAGSTLTVFTRDETNRGGVPTSLFQSINPFCILLFSPLFSVLWIYLDNKPLSPSLATKVGIGLLFMSVAFLTLVFAAVQATREGLANGLFVFMSYVLQTIGELALSPTMLAATTVLSPPKRRATCMAIYFVIAYALSNFISGQIAQESTGSCEASAFPVGSSNSSLPQTLSPVTDTADELLVEARNYTTFFLRIAVVPGILGVLLLLMSKLIMRLAKPSRRRPPQPEAAVEMISTTESGLGGNPLRSTADTKVLPRVGASGDELQLELHGDTAI